MTVIPLWLLCRAGGRNLLGFRRPVADTVELAVVRTLKDALDPKHVLNPDLEGA